MPKVTESHARQRRQQILSAAQECFAARGFHQTSMQELCQCADLSPGAVYSYFRSKEEIIDAMYQERRRQNAGRIEGALARGGTLESFEELARAFFTMFESPAAPTACRLDVELWAEALRSGEINRPFMENLATVRSLIAEVIRRGQQRGELNPTLDAEAAARVVMAFYQGLLLQKAIEPTVEVSSYVAAMMSMIDGTFWQGSTPERAVEQEGNVTSPGKRS